MFGIDKVDEWHLSRWSKFTSSENYKLITGTKPNQIWSPGAWTYIEEKALQAVTKMHERPELEEVKSLLWGKVYEQPAYESYIKETRNHSMTYMGSENPIFLEYEPLRDESGGTPDAVNILKDGKVDHGAEIKCPKNPIEHFRRLMWKDQWDIKENYPLVYTQMQHLMMITKAPIWDFVSFDDRQIMKSKRVKVIEVFPDQKFQDNLHVKLQMAVKKKYEVLSEHLGETVKSRDDFKNLINNK